MPFSIATTIPGLTVVRTDAYAFGLGGNIVLNEAVEPGWLNSCRFRLEEAYRNGERHEYSKPKESGPVMAVARVRA